jgi:serine protease Do
MSFYEKARRQKFLSSMLILFTLAVGVLIGTVLQTGAKAAKEQVVATDATPLTIPNPVILQNQFTKVAKMLEPSVVNISTEYIPKEETQSRKGLRRRQQPQSPDDDDDNGMQEFFQRFFGGGGGMMPMEPQDQRSASLGSGVVVDKNGYILTNNHVVEKATRIHVRFFNDDTEYPATVVGIDKDTDLAVIKVNKKNLIPAHIGNSDALQVGDWAVAVGSPFGFRETVTMGIVSALSRGQEDIGSDVTSFQHFIQTDAAINPGNSGGPLANINGEVIGINTMIASRSGGNQGIGFAMPINTAAKVYNEIIKSGHVTRGSIGVSFTENPDAEQQRDLLKVYGANHGVMVSQVEPGGPAEKAGIKSEDVITSVNGKPVMRGQDLIDMVADTPIGDTVQVGVIRNGKPMTLPVTIGERTKVFAERYGGAKPTPGGGDEGTQMKLGMSIQSLTPAMRQQMNLHANGGIVVQSVEPGSFADDIGLAKGDVIVEMNRQAVNSPQDIQRIQSTLKPGDAVAFKVMREGQTGPRGGEWQPLYLAGSVPANQ